MIYIYIYIYIELIQFVSKPTVPEKFTLPEISISEEKSLVLPSVKSAKQLIFDETVHVTCARAALVKSNNKRYVIRATAMG